MPRKRQTDRPNPTVELDPFAQHVEQALEHFSDPPWLEANSPLAALYFLGKMLTPTPTLPLPHQRGPALCAALCAAAQLLEDELRNLLEKTYFNRPPKYRSNSLLAEEVLHLSERSFYRLRLTAIQQLAQALLRLTKPPLRTEAPQPRAMIGRTTNFATALAALQAEQSVYISGPSGMGKTLLGAALWQHWQTLPAKRPPEGGIGGGRPTFWYTLRGGFNDQVASLLFALGHFLHSQGADFTWRQIVADGGVADLNRVLSLLRNDLAALRHWPPLLCVDEVDALSDETSEHVQILNLLEELKTLCPTLFIGQRVILPLEHHLSLAGLTAEELGALLHASHAPPLSPTQHAQLLTYTRGNPALVILFVALVRDGEAADKVLQGLARSPSLEGLFNRLWRRLDEAEQNLLLQLAVFRNPAPQDVWHTEETTLRRLQERGVVHAEGQGGMRVLAHIQKLAYERIPTDIRPLLHLRAQQVREARAEHLAAMYHAIEGQQPSWAVLHWMAHQDTETERGQGAAALELLLRIDPTTLPQATDREALHLARASLFKLAGRAEEMELELQATTPPPTSVRRAWARRLQGYALEMQGRNEQALQRYREALEALAGMPQYHAVQAHIRISFLQRYRLNDVNQAKREALLARAKADAFLGDIESLAGNYQQALEYLVSAKNSAEAVGSDLLTLSRIYSYLGVVYTKLGELDKALTHYAQAIECDRQRGDKVSPLYDLINQADTYTLAHRYTEAYQIAQQGLETARQLGDGYLIAGLAACLADACYGLQELAEAEHYVQYSLQREEEYFRAPALLTLGKIRLAQAQLVESVQWLGLAQDAAQQTKDPYTEAHILEWLGRAYQRQGALELAHKTLTAAYAAFSALHLAKDLPRLQALLHDDAPAL